MTRKISENSNGPPQWGFVRTTEIAQNAMEAPAPTQPTGEEHLYRIPINWHGKGTQLTHDSLVALSVAKGEAEQRGAQGVQVGMYSGKNVEDDWLNGKSNEQKARYWVYKLCCVLEVKAGIELKKAVFWFMDGSGGRVELVDVIFLDFRIHEPLTKKLKENSILRKRSGITMRKKNSTNNGKDTLDPIYGKLKIDFDMKVGMLKGKIGELVRKDPGYTIEDENKLKSLFPSFPNFIWKNRQGKYSLTNNGPSSSRSLDPNSKRGFLQLPKIQSSRSVSKSATINNELSKRLNHKNVRAGNNANNFFDKTLLASVGPNRARLS